MNRPTGIVAILLSCALAACTAGSSPGTTGGHAGATGGAGAGAAGTGAAGAAGTTTGGAGSVGGSSGGAGASAGSGAAGSDAAVGGQGGGRDAATDAPAGVDATADAADAGTATETGGAACAAGAVICDDFEKYAAGATSLAPDWIAYTYSGTVRVDATKPRGGKQSLHLTTLAGDHHYADIIREKKGEALLPRRHFGRLMVWISSIPTQSHWNVNMSSGPMAGAPNEQAKFFEGGMFGKLMSNYAQRGRIIKNGVELLRAGGPEAGDPGADADCAVAAPAQSVSAGRWLCWEWEFDGTADTARLWVDGQAMTEIDAIGSGKQCQGPGFMGRPMMANYRWEGPVVFDKIFIGWEQYQNTPANEVWIDDVVVGSERVGCPPP